MNSRWQSGLLCCIQIVTCISFQLPLFLNSGQANNQNFAWIQCENWISTSIGWWWYISIVSLGSNHPMKGLLKYGSHTRNSAECPAKNPNKRQRVNNLGYRQSDDSSFMIKDTQRLDCMQFFQPFIENWVHPVFDRSPTSSSTIVSHTFNRDHAVCSIENFTFRLF